MAQDDVDFTDAQSNAIEGDSFDDLPVERDNLKDTLRGMLSKKVDKPPFACPVPAREGVSVVFNANISSQQLNTWRRKSRNKSYGGGVDTIRFAALVLASQNIAIKFNGEVAKNDEGENLTLRDSEIQDMLGALSNLQAVGELFGYEGHMITASQGLLEAAGWGDDDDEFEDDDTAPL